MDTMPIVRLELEGIRHTVLRVFSAHTEEISRLVESELDRVIMGFDFRGAVEKEARIVLEDVVAKSIKRYFVYGEGAEVMHKAVEDAIRKALFPNEPTP